jgi:hypothetical protein
MADYCTILCRRVDYQLATELVKLVFQTAAVELLGEEFNWRKITITTPDSILVLKSKAGFRANDDFSKIVQSALRHCRQLDTGCSTDREYVLNAVRACKMVIGVAAHPGFSQAAGHYECIFGLTRALQGLILNGSRIIDEGGNVLLAAGQRQHTSLP